MVNTAELGKVVHKVMTLHNVTAYLHHNNNPGGLTWPMGVRQFPHCRLGGIEDSMKLKYIWITDSLLLVVILALQIFEDMVIQLFILVKNKETLNEI